MIAPDAPTAMPAIAPLPRPLDEELGGSAMMVLLDWMSSELVDDAEVEVESMIEDVGNKRSVEDVEVVEGVVTEDDTLIS